MIKTLLLISFGVYLFLCTSHPTYAQVDGNPRLNVAPVPMAAMAKSNSKLSEPLAQLYQSYSASALNSANAKVKPVALDPAISKLMHIVGDQVLVDIAVNEYNSALRVKLEKMGVKIIAVYGRMISAKIPISSLPLFESSPIVRYVKPAYRPMRQSRPGAAWD